MTDRRPGRRKGTPKTGGRQRGTPNKVTVEVRALATSLVEMPAYRKSLERRLVGGKLAPAMEVLLWHFAYGKPKETVELNATHDVQKSVEHLVTPQQCEAEMVRHAKEILAKYDRTANVNERAAAPSDYATANAFADGA